MQNKEFINVLVKDQTHFEKVIVEFIMMERSWVNEKVVVEVVSKYIDQHKTE